MQLLGQVSDPSHSCNLSHSCGNASGPLNHCARLWIEPRAPKTPLILFRHNGNSCDFFLFWLESVYHTRPPHSDPSHFPAPTIPSPPFPNLLTTSLRLYLGCPRDSLISTNFFFNWHVVNLQGYVSFKCTVKWFSCVYTHIFSDSFLLWIITSYWVDFSALYS